MVKKSQSRFGGEYRDECFHFELSGGAPALDFVNTVVTRAGNPEELLTSFERLLGWAEQSELLSLETAGKVMDEAKRKPRDARRALARAHEFRETLYQIFRSIVVGQPLTGKLLDELLEWKRRSLAERRLRQIGTTLQWDHGTNFASALWPVVDSAFLLLTSPDDTRRLRLCAGETCEWLFLDRSKRLNRRWCDMSVCGNRAKVRRHYQRSRGLARSVERSRARAAVKSPLE